MDAVQCCSLLGGKFDNLTPSWFMPCQFYLTVIVLLCQCDHWREHGTRLICQLHWFVCAVPWCGVQKRSVQTIVKMGLRMPLRVLVTLWAALPVSNNSSGLSVRPVGYTLASMLFAHIYALPFPCINYLASNRVHLRFSRTSTGWIETSHNPIKSSELMVASVGRCNFMTNLLEWLNPFLNCHFTSVWAG